MKVVTPEQMREIDRAVINGVGIPGIVLMENAAVSVVNAAEALCGAISGKRIVIIAGKGNNGGDAFAAARHFVNRGAGVKAYISVSETQVAGDAAVNLAVLHKMGVEVSELLEESNVEDLRGSLHDADLVIDGLFGTGFRGKAEGLAAELIESLNNSGKAIISIDVPSGLDAATGRIEGPCITASKTVTLGLPKTGLLVYPGREYTGELVVADISLPASVIDSMDIKINTIEEDFVSGVIPARRPQSNKGDYGKMFIITGSTGMTGAGCLCAKAALSVGAGLVYLGVPASLVPIYDSIVLESVSIPLEDGGTGRILRRSADVISSMLDRVDIAVVGPGLSQSDDIFYIIEYIIQKARIPMVLDADALNAIAGNISILKDLKAEVIVTPHPGEMSRLTGISIHDIQNNRLEVAVDFARKWKAITVLKGASTIIALPDGTTYINTAGNAGMATGGTGDVLAGTIAGLAGQGMKLREAAAAGVYLHAKAGDMAAGEKGEYGMTAGDVAAALPYVIKQAQKKK